MQEDGAYCTTDYIRICQQQKKLRDDQAYGAVKNKEVDEWRNAAEAGQPAGSSSPVVEPLKKAQLTAQKRLEKEKALKALKASPKKKAKEEEQGKMSDKVKGKMYDKVKPIKEKQAKGKSKDKGSGKAKRNASAGPLAIAMKEFIAAKRAEGLSYAEALKLWRTSTMRADIVGSLSASEQKRRRYV